VHSEGRKGEKLPSRDLGPRLIQRLAVRALLARTTLAFARQAVTRPNAEADFAFIVVVPEVFQS
jgi:hypothetical protein